MTGKKFYFFTEAWWFLQDHPKLEDIGIMQCLDIFVTKINPHTKTVDDDKTKNTETEVWLEFGFPEYKCYEHRKDVIPTHDIRFDCGAPTFEEAIVKLANLVKKHD